MMMHLDIAVEDLDAGLAWAQELGATAVEHQTQRHVRVMLDPDGHPGEAGSPGSACARTSCAMRIWLPIPSAQRLAFWTSSDSTCLLGG